MFSTLSKVTHDLNPKGPQSPPALTLRQGLKSRATSYWLSGFEKRHRLP